MFCKKTCTDFISFLFLTAKLRKFTDIIKFFITYLYEKMSFWETFALIKKHNVLL